MNDMERRIAQCIRIDGDAGKVKEARPKLEVGYRRLVRTCPILDRCFSKKKYNMN